MTHSKTVTAGETFIFSTNYSSTRQTKFLCKGEDPSTCTRWWTGEPVLRDTVTGLASHVTVTLQAVALADAGTYWCGARSVQGRASHLIFYRLLLHVGKAGPGGLVAPRGRLGGGLTQCGVEPVVQ